MTVLVLLTVSTKSLAQSKTCYSPKQVKAINNVRIDYEKCQADLIDTHLTLDEIAINSPPTDYMTPIFAGVGGILVGVIVGGIIGANSK